MKKQTISYIKSLHVKPGKKINLEKDYRTSSNQKTISKKEGQKLLADGIVELARLQEMLYAYNKYSVLIVLQAMDAAGKDGAIKHVMTGFNPQGVKVSSFKVPSSTELDHDYFWRHYKELPGRGEIGIFNRSHYENVLVTRVHPEYILNENIPGINTVKDIDRKFWEARYTQINRFEQNLYENGTMVLKLFLHVSKDEQKKRFIERIDDPEKNWKFSVADYNERQHWKKYMNAYEEMLAATSTDYAPWFVIPADEKWFTRLIIGSIIIRQFEKLNISYPKVSKEMREKLLELKEEILSER
jgi:PPK2 family polyphosphate:nucleotide phosphotransferase